MLRLRELFQRTGLRGLRTGACLVITLAVCATLCTAQLPIPPSTQFDVTGFLQDATVTTPGDAHSGGTLRVNGQTITVPRETIVILPANALTWQELFAQAPAPYTGVATGMAMSDVPTPMSTYEVHVVGNRVLGAPGGDQYIAALIDIAQQGLNSGAGFINFIDYTLGEMRVGGIINDPFCAQGGTPISNPTCSGTRVRINDPSGRYGRVMSPDVRFTVDPDNPTISAGSGYPMCFPRTPLGTADPLCPESNRPQILAGPAPGVLTYLSLFTTVNATNPAFPIGVVNLGGTMPVVGDSHFQVPFEIGDYITYSGTLVNDTGTPTAGPWPGTPNTYISAHTIEDNIGVYTFPGSNPAYVRTDVTLIGTGGLSVLGVGEAVIRTRFEGMTTDVANSTDFPGSVQRGIHLYGIDLTPGGAFSDRDWGTIGVDPGAPLGAVRGRWRFRPPCAVFGTVPAKPDKQCVMNASGTFLPPTREMRAVIEGLQGQTAAFATIPPVAALTSANGIVWGQYHAPILEYIFPENVPGTPIVENNVNTIDFLACGGYTSSGNTLAGVLSPWPSATRPAACAGSCVPTNPTLSASPASAAAGTVVTLTATSAGTLPITYTITQNPADAIQVLPAGGVIGTTATFTAPAVAGGTTLNFTVTAANCGGTLSASVTVVVSAPAAPTVSFTPVAPVTVTSGNQFGPFTATCTDPGRLTPCTFLWTQTNIGAPGIPTVIPAGGIAAARVGPFTVTLAPGQPAVTIQLQVVATNTARVPSAPKFTSVTVVPVVDGITITGSVYRFSKQRLDLTVTDTVVSPALILTLQPYACQDAAAAQCPNGIFNPASLGNVLTNTGNGLYTMTIVGAPEPACRPGNINAPCTTPSIVVTSNTGGSGVSVLQTTRQ